MFNEHSMTEEESAEIPWANATNDQTEIPWANAEDKTNITGTAMGGHTPAMISQYTTTNATLAIILSSIGAVLLVGSGGGGICCSIPGIILANGALTITDSQPGHPDAGMARAAQILGWIVTAITIILVLGFLLLLGGLGGLGLMFS